MQGTSSTRSVPAKRGRGGRRRRRLSVLACWGVVGVAACGLSGCLYPTTPLPGGDITQYITGPPGWTAVAGSRPSFSLVGAAFDFDNTLCPARVAWQFKDDVTKGWTQLGGQDVLATDEHGVGRNRLGQAVDVCKTAAPTVALPSWFDNDGQTHHITLTVEMADTFRCGGLRYGCNDIYIAQGSIDFTLTPAPIRLPPPVQLPPPALTVAPISFASPVAYPTPQNPTALATGDLHLNSSGAADGRADVAVAEASTRTAPSRLQVWRSAADGALSPYGGPYQFPAGVTIGRLVAGDLAGPQQPALALTDAAGSAVRVLRGDGHGNFSVPGDAYLVGSHPGPLATGRLCGSASTDLVAANFYTNDVTVLCNNGDGTFTAGVGGSHFFHIGGTRPVAVTTADLNGDHQPDIVVATQGAPAAIDILRNTSSSAGLSFASAEPISAYTGGLPADLAIGDLNRDGRPDIVVDNSTSDGTVSVLINSTAPGSSTFSFSEHTYSVGPGDTRPGAVTLGDFSGTGVSDIATANLDSNNASVLQGNGDGTFGPAVLVPAGTGPDAIAAADLTGSGRDDLIVANYWSDSVTVALSTSHGSGQIAPARDRTHRMHHPTLRRLHAHLALRISRPHSARFAQDGLVIDFGGVSATGRITSRLIGGAAAVRALPPGALDLLDVDFGATGGASRYFDPPLDPVFLRGTMLWRSRRDRRLLACVSLRPAHPVHGVPTVQQLTVTGGTGALARLRITLQLPAFSFEHPPQNPVVTAAVARGPARGLSSACRALVRKLPRR